MNLVPQLTCVILTDLILRELMELIAERLHDKGIKVLLVRFALVLKWAYTEQDTQGTENGDRQRDGVNDQPHEEPHG